MGTPSAPAPGLGLSWGAGQAAGLFCLYPFSSVMQKLYPRQTRLGRLGVSSPTQPPLVCGSSTPGAEAHGGWCQLAPSSLVGRRCGRKGESRRPRAATITAPPHTYYPLIQDTCPRPHLWCSGAGDLPGRKAGQMKKEPCCSGSPKDWLCLERRAELATSRDVGHGAVLGIPVVAGDRQEHRDLSPAATKS